VFIFPFILLGGFKIPALAFITPGQLEADDWSLTLLGCFGAFFIFMSRFLMQLVSETHLIDPKQALTFSTLLLFSMIVIAKLQFPCAPTL
jgi:lipid-A-disaccharide synthase-like uncharacterized protein